LRVFAVGPQVGYIFPVDDMQGYGEFGAKNRPEGWNVWLTLAISRSAAAQVAAKPTIRN
jgi:hypothetical protein